MRLEAVRVKAFRSIKDTGWVALNSLTGLVGENESGKTSFLLAISRLAIDVSFDEAEDQSHFFEEEFPEVNARFLLTEEEKAQISTTSKFNISDNAMILSKTLSNNYNAFVGNIILFDSAPANEMSMKSSSEKATSWTTTMKKNYASTVSSLKELANSSDISDQPHYLGLINEIISVLDIVYTSPDVQMDKVSPQLDKLKAIGFIDDDTYDDWVNSFAEELGQNKSTDLTIQQLIGSLMPKFLYFDKYDILDGEYTEEQLDQLDKNSTIHKLLRLGKINTKAIFDAKESTREQQSDRARAVVQGLLNQDWKQKNVAVRFRFGEQKGTKQLTLLVQTDGSLPVPFLQRSDGFKWFLSFYAAFNYANADLKNTVLLLDDPAVSLHAKGQKDAYTAFERLAQKDNVIVFTTHSPFLVDLENLHRYRIVENKDELNEGTLIRYAFGDDAIVPIQPIMSAMGCPVGSSFSIKSRFLIPEGPIDYFLLHAALGIARPDCQLHQSIGIAPAKNAGNVLPVTAFYVSLGFDSIGLLDGDLAGREAMNSAKEKGLDKIINLVDSNDLLKVDYMEALFDYPTYVDAVAEAHNLRDDVRTKLLTDLPPDNNYKSHIQGWFKKHRKGPFSGLATAMQLANRFDPLNATALPAPSELVKKTTDIVKSIHSLFKIS